MKREYIFTDKQSPLLPLFLLREQLGMSSYGLSLVYHLFMEYITTRNGGDIILFIGHVFLLTQQ